MIGKKLSRVPKHKQFNYKTRYYSAEKEKLAKRMEMLTKAKAGDKEAIKERMVSRMRKGYIDTSKTRSQALLKSNLLLFGLIVGLSVFAFLFIHRYLPTLVDAMYR